jgi:hypothetical protein
VNSQVSESSKTIAEGSYYQTQNITIGSGRAVLRGNFKYAELILYTSSQAANRTFIENNINTYYNVYTSSNAGYVARWYDQSGNNRHATQTATGSQPLIVLSGSVLTEPTSSKPTLNFNTNKSLNNPNGLFSQPNTFFVVEDAPAGERVSISSTDASNSNQVYTEPVSPFRMNAGVDLIGATIASGHRLATSIFNTSNSTGFQNNILRASGNAGTENQQGLQIGTPSYGNGFYQEVIHYNSNQSINREAVEYGINNYYNIYTQPTSSNWATSSFTIKADSGSISGSLNNRLTSGIASSGPLGLITVSRTGSNSLTVSKNLTTSSFTVPASGALSTNIYLGAINNNGIALGNSPYRISYASIGIGLTNTEIQTYYRLIDSFQINSQIQPPLLNLYPSASIAFSVRKLNASYTGPAMDVRRSSDNTTLSVGFKSNGDLDTATLLDFIGTYTGYVQKWYDQSGNNNHLTLASGTGHSIVENGVLLTLNGKPNLKSNGGAYNFVNSSIYASATSATVFMALYPAGRNYLGHPLRSTLAGQTNHYTSFGTIQENIGRSSRTDIYNYPAATSLSDGFFNTLYTIAADGSTSKYYTNGVLRLNTSYGSGYTSVTYQHAGGNYIGSIQEMISYNSNQTQNLQLIENNIRTYFNIY